MFGAQPWWAVGGEFDTLCSFICHPERSEARAQSKDDSELEGESLPPPATARIEMLVVLLRVLLEKTRPGKLRL